MKKGKLVIMLFIASSAFIFFGCSMAPVSESDQSLESSYENATEYKIGKMTYFVDDVWGITYQDDRQILYTSPNQEGSLRIECIDSFSSTPAKYIESSWPESDVRKVTVAEDVHNYGGANFTTATINYIGESPESTALVCALVDGQAYIVMYSAPLTQSIDDSPFYRTVASISFR